MSFHYDSQSPEPRTPTNTHFRVASPQEWLKEVCTGREYAALSPESKKGMRKERRYEEDEKDITPLSSRSGDRSLGPSPRNPVDPKRRLDDDFPPKSEPMISSDTSPTQTSSRSPRHIASRSTLIRALSPETFYHISSPTTDPTSSLATAWDLAAERMIVYFDGDEESGDLNTEGSERDSIRGRLRGIGEIGDRGPHIDDGRDEDQEERTTKDRPSDAELKRRQDEIEMRVDQGRAREGYLAWERKEEETHERIVVNVDGRVMVDDPTGSNLSGRVRSEPRSPLRKVSGETFRTNGNDQTAPPLGPEYQTSNTVSNHPRSGRGTTERRLRRPSNRFSPSDHIGPSLSIREDRMRATGSYHPESSREEGTGEVLRIRGGRRYVFEGEVDMVRAGDRRNRPRKRGLLRGVSPDLENQNDEGPERGKRGVRGPRRHDPSARRRYIQGDDFYRSDSDECLDYEAREGRSIGLDEGGDGSFDVRELV